MPRSLFQFSDWKLLSVTQLKRGDIVFVNKIGKKNLVSHVALAMSDEEIVHCSREFGSVQILTTNIFFEIYEQGCTCREALRYIDTMDKKLREKNNGRFIEY